ncbi:MAG TPA: hypothetical protein DEA63_03355 [Firmicutes bacterium]|nr:hypothetical protein [Bacillota bacterium]
MAKHSLFSFFLLRNLRQDLGKNLLCLTSSFIGVSSLLLSLGYFLGYQGALSNQVEQSPEYGVFQVQEKRKVSLSNSPLKLVETSRPPLDSCLDFDQENEIEWGLNFSYFLPTETVFYLNGIQKETIKICVIPSFASLQERGIRLEYGQIPEETVDYCVVNHEFSQQYLKNEKGGTVSFRTSFSLPGDEGDTTLDYEFQIEAVTPDFPFLATPKVYLSYSALADFYSSTGFGDERSSIYQMVESSAGNSPLSGYSRFAFCTTGRSARVLSSYDSSEDGLSFFSEVANTANSFLTLSQGFSSSLSLFSTLSLAGVCLILIMTNCSNFVLRKKETAILYCLGVSQRTVRQLYFLESLTICLSAVFLSLVFAPLLQWGANRLFQSEFGLSDLVSIPTSSMFGCPFLLETLLLFFSLLVAFLSVLPLKRAKANSLNEELRDE